MALKNIIEICVAIDVAILGIAYPIIVNKTSNIGDKYSSQYLSNIFNNEFPQKGRKFTFKIPKKNKFTFEFSIFELNLFATLFSFIFLIFRIQPLWGLNNWLVNNSADLIVFMLTASLIILFLIWLRKVALYNGKTTSLLKYLIKNHSKFKADSEIRKYHLKAINEIAFYAIEKQDEHIQETLREFYYSEFAKIKREHDKTQPLVYPVDLYSLVYKLNEIIAEKGGTRLRAIEHRAVSGSWLLGQHSGETIISQDTYRWLCRNIYTICDSPRLVKMFWANSSQYYNFELQSIYPIYVFGQRDIIIQNQNQLDKREKERDRFLEFHYALGGLLLYRKQYKTLKYMFEYSQSLPPKYVLLPNNMTQVFKWFEYFIDDFKHTMPIDIKYHFPGLDNLGISKQVNFWICSYITILFIRQFSLHQYYVDQCFTGHPNLPDDFLELNNLLNAVSSFNKYLENVLLNKELIKALEFEKLVETKESDFSSFINDLKANIEETIEKRRLDAQVSEKRVESFYENSNKIILEAFNSYKEIFSKKDSEHANGELKPSVNRIVTLLPKSAFIDNDIPHMGFDTVLAKKIANQNIKRHIPNSFLTARTKRYLLNKDSIFIALDKIIGKNKDVVIVGINISMQFGKTFSNINDRYTVKEISSTDYKLKDTLFVLKKKDLPAIEYKDLDENEIEDLKLKCINEDFKIYASVIDINKDENIELK